MRKLGVGLVGAGSIGAVHAENLAKRIPPASLSAICDVNTDLGNQTGKILGVEKVYSEYEKLLDDESVEALVLAVPTFLKHKMLLQAFHSGKHVFVEKPLALTLEEADSIIKESEKAHTKLQIGYQRRFDKAYEKAQKAVSSGEVGKTLIVRSWTRDPPSVPSGWSIDPKLSGGIWLDTCSHDFDSVLFLTGSRVLSVYATGANLVYEQLKPHRGFDNVLVTLELDNAALAQVDSCGYTSYGYDAGAEVLGTLGRVSIGMGRNSPVHIEGKSGLTRDLPQSYQERFARAYHDELEDFVKCVLEDKEPKVTGKNGRDAIEIGLAAKESADKRQPVLLK